MKDLWKPTENLNIWHYKSDTSELWRVILHSGDHVYFYSYEEALQAIPDLHL